jgi:hypothetical protein
VFNNEICVAWGTDSTDFSVTSFVILLVRTTGTLISDSGSQDVNLGEVFLWGKIDCLHCPVL